MRGAVLAAVLLAGPALAQERPTLVPERDVDVIYMMAGPRGPLEQRLRWGVAQGKMRVDPPSPGLFMVVDMRSHRAETVRERDRVVIQLDSAQPLPGVASGAAFVRQGEARIAGLACTQWATTDADGHATVACITADGVLLQAASGGQVLAIAIAVRYSPQADVVFDVPADYRRIIAAPVKH